MLETELWNILIVGIGGQGITTISQLLQQYLTQLPQVIQITATESRGVSQREGSVMAFIRCLLMNPNKSSETISLAPVPPIQGVHLLIAFEATEFLRSAQYLRPDGIAVVNSMEITPKSAIATKTLLDPPLKTRLQKIRAIYPLANIDLQNISIQENRGEMELINIAQIQINLLERLPSLVPELFQSEGFYDLLRNLKERKDSRK